MWNSEAENEILGFVYSKESKRAKHLQAIHPEKKKLLKKQKKKGICDCCFLLSFLKSEFLCWWHNHLINLYEKIMKGNKEIWNPSSADMLTNPSNSNGASLDVGKMKH